MKTLQIAALILTVLFANIVTAQDSKEIKEVKFKADVKCNSCKAKIEKNMAFAKGVKAVDADVETKVVTIKYRSDKTTPAELEKELKKCGFGAELVNSKKHSGCSSKSKHKPCPKSGSKACCAGHK